MKNRNYTINCYLENKMINHLNALQAKYSKLLPIRIDFHYKKGVMPLEYSVDAYMDMLKLSNEALWQKIVVGYAWVMEYSKNEDIHFHAIFYLNGQKHIKYFPVYDKIDKMWLAITEEQGYTYDANRYQEQFIIQGLNLLSHDDKAGTDALKYVLSYFAKEEQKARFSSDLHANFKTSEVAPPSGRGRPRKKNNKS